MEHRSGRWRRRRGGVICQVAVLPMGEIIARVFVDCQMPCGKTLRLIMGCQPLQVCNVSRSCAISSVALQAPISSGCCNRGPGSPNPSSTRSAAATPPGSLPFSSASRSSPRSAASVSRGTYAHPKRSSSWRAGFSAWLYSLSLAGVVIELLSQGRVRTTVCWRHSTSPLHPTIDRTSTMCWRPLLHSPFLGSLRPTSSITGCGDAC